MDNYNNDKKSLELSRMEVQADLMESLDSALQVMTKLNEAVIYLDFENHSMIQRYYSALKSTTEGLQFLQEGFSTLASAYGIKLDDYL
jgi:hypothetical protein